jgi:Glycosyl hydrolase family 12
MLSRHAIPLLVLAAIALLAAPAAAASGAAGQASASLARTVTICKQRAHVEVTSAGGRHYLVKNDNYGGRRECLRVAGGRPSFTVTASRANGRGSNVMAYPFVLYGCSWGLCTKGSRLPMRVSQVHRARASWSFSGHARGRWNAAFDIWFGRHRSAARGQARGAELMIWLNSRGYPAVRASAIRVDHRRWYVTHWRTSHAGRHWTYIQVRAARSASGVRGLALMPIIRRVERMHLIKRRWWLLNVEAGFEIWHGGRGLATRSFDATVRA